MRRNLTGDDVETQIKRLIALREPTKHQAHDEFNKGFKFATDYLLEYISIEYRPTRWQKFRKRIGL